MQVRRSRRSIGSSYIEYASLLYPISIIHNRRLEGETKSVIKSSMTLAAFMFATASTAEAKMGLCLLEVNNRPYLLGPCNIDLDPGGDFSIGTGSKTVGSPYFAYVSISPDGTAIGNWNETRGSTHAHTSLGTLKRIGACWINDNAKVCAWK